MEPSSEMIEAGLSTTTALLCTHRCGSPSLNELLEGSPVGSARDRLRASTDDGSAGVMYRSIDRTAEALGADGERWRRILGSVNRFENLIAGVQSRS